MRDTIFTVTQNHLLEWKRNYGCLPHRWMRADVLCSDTKKGEDLCPAVGSLESRTGRLVALRRNVRPGQMQAAVEEVSGHPILSLTS